MLYTRLGGLCGELIAHPKAASGSSSACQHASAGSWPSERITMMSKSSFIALGRSVERLRLHFGGDMNDHTVFACLLTCGNARTPTEEEIVIRNGCLGCVGKLQWLQYGTAQHCDHVPSIQ